MFVAALFPMVKKWKQPVCPLTDEWMDKTWSVHTVEYYVPMKRNEALTHSTIWRNLKNIKPSEEKPDPEGPILCDSIYVKYPE